MPGRTTKEYEEPVIAPKVAAALEDALRDEDEIQVDAAALYSAGSLGLRGLYGGLSASLSASSSAGSLGAISPGALTGAGGSAKKPKSG